MSSDFDQRLDLALLCFETVSMCYQLAFLHLLSNLPDNVVNKSVHGVTANCACLAGGCDVKASGSPQALEAHCTDVVQHMETAATQGRKPRVPGLVLNSNSLPGADCI